jgi:transcriptional regulator with XRE-family HTH domain
MIFFFFFFFNDTFAARLADIMQSRSMSVRGLSIYTGVKKATIKHWLNGTYEPMHCNLSKLVDVLEVTDNYLCHSNH